MLEIQLKQEQPYWQNNVLKRVVHVIKFLVERGLAFRGANETFGSPHNGNFLGILELISQFDPFLSDHLTRFGNSGSGISSYPSSFTHEELIGLMENLIKSVVIQEINDAKYFSISVDGAPDLSHTDQLTIIIRDVQVAGAPIERFLSFLAITDHSAENLADAILNYCQKNGIDFSNCRDQSCDNASIMSGKYKARLKEINPPAVYIPCAGHSLNLVGKRQLNAVWTS